MESSVLNRKYCIQTPQKMGDFADSPDNYEINILDGSLTTKTGPGEEGDVVWKVRHEKGKLLFDFKGMWKANEPDDLGPLTIKMSKSFLSDDPDAAICLTKLYIDPNGDGRCP